MLVSKGVPLDLPHLDRDWRRAIPIGGRPHYESTDDMPAHVFYHMGHWYIADAELPNVLMYASSKSQAARPEDIPPGEWMALVAWPDEWRALSGFSLAGEGFDPSTSGL